MASMRDVSLCCILSSFPWAWKAYVDYVLSYCLLMEWVECLLKITFFIRNLGPQLVYMIWGTHTTVFVSFGCATLHFKQRYNGRCCGFKTVPKSKQCCDVGIEDCLINSRKECRLSRTLKDKDIEDFRFNDWMDKDIKKSLFRSRKDKNHQKCLFRIWKDKDIQKSWSRSWSVKNNREGFLRSWERRGESECFFRGWKDLVQWNGAAFHHQYCVFPATAVPDRVVEAMRRHARRYASFAAEVCPPVMIPSTTWPNRLARAGYYYAETTGRICCFACQEKYPDHSRDCDRQNENIDFFEDDYVVTNDTSDDAGSTINALRLRAWNSNQRSSVLSGSLDEASTLADQGNGPSQGSSSSEDVGSAGQTAVFSEIPGNQSSVLPPTDHLVLSVPESIPLSSTLPSLEELPEISTKVLNTIAEPGFSMSSLSRRRGSFSSDWRGPPVSIMADCGLYQVSSSSARCHSCGVTFRELTGNTCIWSLHSTMAPHCQFLRFFREG